MEEIQISQAGNGLHVEGFPDAEKVVHLRGHKARRLEDLALHRHDLNLALHCLQTINSVPSGDHQHRQALWHAGIIYYVKCFSTNSSRTQLNEKKVYRDDPPPEEVWSFFRDLRNKHIAHDDNSYAQSIVGAIINGAEAAQIIEKIVAVTFVASVLNQGNWSNLQLLASRAIQWVEHEFDELADSVRSDLEKMPREELIAMRAIEYRQPTLEDLSVTRQRDN